MPLGSASLMPRVDVEQRHAIAVDRNLDLLAARGAAVQLSGRNAVEHHAEGVLAVCRKDVHHGRAATSANWRARHVPQLRRGARHFVDHAGWRRRGVANRVAADLGRRTQIPFKHRRRKRLHVGDVVEAVQMVSGGSSADTSTSMPSSPSIAAAYSARLKRWKGRRPGFGRTAATRSIRVSIDEANAVSVASSGRLAPAGGIMPARSLRIIFSASSGCCSIADASNAANDKPPAFPRSL